MAKRAEVVTDLADRSDGQYKYDVYYSGVNRPYPFTINIQPNASTIMGFSISAEEAVRVAADSARTGRCNRLFIVSGESSSANPVRLTQEQRNALIDNNAVIINAYVNKRRSLTNSQHMGTDVQGIHRIDLETKLWRGNQLDVSSSHHVIVKDLLNSSNIMRLSNGTYDFRSLPTSYTYPSNRFGGKTYDITYDIYDVTYDASGTEHRRKITAEEANQIVSLNGSMGFNADALRSQLDATGVGMLGITGTVSSDMQLVQDSMNSIRSQVSDTSFLTQLQSFEIPADGRVGAYISENLNTFYDANNVLMDSLLQETEAVVSYGQAVTDMDADLARGIPNGTILEGEASGTKLKSSYPSYNAKSLRTKNMFENTYDITADDLNRLFEYWAKKKNNPNSQIRGMGEAFMAASKATGIDPLVLVGICGEETGYGGNGNKSNWIENHNFFGIKYIDANGDGRSELWGGSVTLYKTNAEGIMAGAMRIKNFYCGKYGCKSAYDLDAVGYNGTGGAGNYSSAIGSIMKDSLDYIFSGKNVQFTTPAQTAGTSAVQLRQTGSSTSGGASSLGVGSAGSTYYPTSGGSSGTSYSPSTSYPTSTYRGDETTTVKTVTTPTTRPHTGLFQALQSPTSQTSSPVVSYERPSSTQTTYDSPTVPSDRSEYEAIPYTGVTEPDQVINKGIEYSASKPILVNNKTSNASAIAGAGLAISTAVAASLAAIKKKQREEKEKDEEWTE